MSRPLAGRTIVNTRATHQADELDRLLCAAGGQPVAYPCIAITPPADTGDLDAALHALGTGAFDWLIVTSVNTVSAIASRLGALGLSLANAPAKIAAVGPSTADAARETLQRSVAFVPDTHTAEALAQSLPIAAGARILLPESAIAHPALAESLRARGAQVTVIAAYRTVCATAGGEDVPRLLADGRIDALTFTSSSTVDCFLERIKRANRLSEAVLVCAACIGPRTADTARDAGFSSIVVAQPHTLRGLVDALSNHFRPSVVSGDPS